MSSKRRCAYPKSSSSSENADFEVDQIEKNGTPLVNEQDEK
jgi:hypothetical protein